MGGLDQATASRFAASTLGHLTREWPFKLGQVLTDPNDLATPRTLHPIFHGSYDWHSCVHGWWQVVRLARLFPIMTETVAIEALADRMLVPHRVVGELAFMDRPENAGFARPYGWAWLLTLHDELALRAERPWAAAIKPLAEAIADRLADYLPRLTYPVRSGKHDNTAFALIHAHRWAMSHDPELATLIEARARDWFGADRDCRPWEPGGEDFLSATLCEAVLMRAVMREGYQEWLTAFLPNPFGEVVATLCTPAIVNDRGDGQFAHLDGLNLSRAWCWRSLSGSLPDPAHAMRIAEAHLAAAMPHLTSDYMGEHWLATFALLALTA